VITEQLDHALPFAAIFEELRAVRPTGFASHVGAALIPWDLWRNTIATVGQEAASQQALTVLATTLEQQRAAYESLEQAKHQIAKGHFCHGNGIKIDLDALEIACYEIDQPLKRVLYHLRGNAVAFSGGGIRSASFCLGILQGLSRFSCGSCEQDKPEPGLMDDVQYLSTVSGGGYLGSWFSSWIYRRAKLKTVTTGVSYQSACGSAYREIVRMLAGAGKHTSGDPSPEPIRHLRQFTSYLAPQLGFTLDLWTLAAIVLRNLLVNWLMIVPVLMSLLLLPLLAAFLLQQSAAWGATLHPVIFYGVFGGLLAMLGLAAGLNLPSRMAQKDGAVQRLKRAGLTGVVIKFLLPALLVCWLTAWRYYPGYAGHFSPWRAATLSAMIAVGYGVLGLLKWFTYIDIPKPEMPLERAFHRTLTAVLLAVVTLLTSLATGIATEVMGTVLLPRLPLWRVSLGDSSVEFAGYVVLAIPAFLSVLLLGSTLFAALTDKLEAEEDREWAARAGGLLMTSGFLWMAGTGLALFSTGPFFGKFAAPGVLVGAFTSWMAKSSVTTAGTRPEKSALQSPVTKFLQKNHLILPALSIASLLLIAVGLLRGAENIRRKLPYGDDPARSCFILLVALTGLFLLINWLININIFSLHGMYRERLARAFLGASNRDRMPDPFTDFDKNDTPYMADLPRAEGVPLHVVGTTLNLVGTKRAEWRQRKAESFTFSAVSAGSWRLNYIPCASYGGSSGVTLSTAMAISGAAANPNMGYHSSPLVSILMTLFNVRLGWWLPNPSLPLKEKMEGHSRRQYLSRSGPTLGVVPLIQELFGLTDDDGAWIELTDGGHFDNLGLYEMVLRRCGNIFVVDAGADPDAHFEDLGNALRKIEIDLGVQIKFKEPLNMYSRHSDKAGESRYCAVAEIMYDCVDSGCCQEEGYADPFTGDRPMNGRLIYVKAGLTGSEPMDVSEYAFSHPTFPHEATSNQFFNEAQFESYRHFGSNIVDVIGASAKGSSWTSLIAAAQTYASTSPR
jgi:hypothetical protein